MYKYKLQSPLSNKTQVQNHSTEYQHFAQVYVSICLSLRIWVLIYWNLALGQGLLQPIRYLASSQGYYTASSQGYFLASSRGYFLAPSQGYFLASSRGYFLASSLGLLFGLDIRDYFLASSQGYFWPRVGATL